MNQGLSMWGWISLGIGWGLILSLCFYCFSRVLFGKKKGFGGGEGVPGERDRWGTRVGLILAMAGNAIGLGNFLRFPVKAAANGGGAFLIPYFCALLFLGIPLMWVEWTIGRIGGARGHSSAPGMFSLLWRHPLGKYVGAFGVFLPLTIAIYYTFVESWTLAFAFFSGTGKYFGNTSRQAMGQFLKGYQGVEANQYFSSIFPALIFLGIAMTVNYFFLSRGLSRGIEILARYGMPLMFVFAVILVIRVLTLGTPDPAHPDWNIANGMGFIWNPDFSRLSQASVWLVAAGQIFFTLSLGQGMVHTYASYVREQEDITLNGLSTSSVNEVAELILGGTIAIPVAVAFFGLTETQQIAQQGAFDLGFISLPVIFQQIPLGQFFGALWFLLLFIAGITTSVAMAQTMVAFLMDEFKWTRAKAVNTFVSIVTGGILFVLVFFKFGVLDEIDFWAGTFGIVIFGVLEIILFSWVFGIDRGWKEMHKGADFRVPGFMKYVIKYVTPVYMLVILGVWTYQDAVSSFLMKGKDPASRPYLWGARLIMALIILTTILMVRAAWKKKRTEEQAVQSGV